MAKQRKALSKSLSSLLICIIILTSFGGYVIIHTDTCTGHNNPVVPLHDEINVKDTHVDNTK